MSAIDCSHLLLIHWKICGMYLWWLFQSLKLQWPNILFQILYISDSEIHIYLNWCDFTNDSRNHPKKLCCDNSVNKKHSFIWLRHHCVCLSDTNSFTNHRERKKSLSLLIVYLYSDEYCTIQLFHWTKQQCA